MKIIPPIGLSVASIGTTPTYVHEEWVTGTKYDRYDTVRRQLNGTWYSFRTKYSFTTAVGPTQTYSTYYWEFLGESPMIGGLNYISDISLSLYDEWTSGTAVSAGAVYYDPSDRNDYVALLSITSGNNTVRPSDAVLSSDEEIAARWRLIGAANTFAMVNYTSSVSTKFVDPSSGAPAASDSWVVVNFSNPSVNLITAPNDFSSTYWTLDKCSVTSDAITDPIGNTLSADTMTALSTASSAFPASIWRIGGYHKQGDKVVFGVFLKSSNVTSCVIKLIELTETGTNDSVHTFNVTNSWRYVQIAHTVGDGTSGRVFIEIGFLPTADLQLSLWGAHYGLVADCFDHIALMGLRYAKLVRAGLYFYSDSINNDYSYSVELSETPHSDLRTDLAKTVSLVATLDTLGSGLFQSNTGLYYATQMAQFWVTCTSASSTQPAEIRSLVLGQATTIGYTEWGVETSLLSFSRKERDENFGTVKFVKRGSASSVRATAFIDTDQINADEVYQILAAFDGQPIVMDFNNPGSDYERLKLFGFYTNVRTIIQANSYESLGIDVESLVQ